MWHRDGKNRQGAAFMMFAERNRCASVGAVRALAEALAAFAPGHRVPGKTTIQVTPGR
jgi:hypothetical protein